MIYFYLSCCIKAKTSQSSSYYKKGEKEHKMKTLSLKIALGLGKKQVSQETTKQFKRGI